MAGYIYNEIDNELSKTKNTSENSWFVNIDKIEMKLPRNQQIDNDRYRGDGDRMDVYTDFVEKTPDGPDRIKATLTMLPQKPSTILILNVLSRHCMRGMRGTTPKELIPSK